MLEPEQLNQQAEDARARTLLLIEDLDDRQLIGPYLPTVNPLLWEIGHVAYFYEYWIVRKHYGQSPWRDNIDLLYDSIDIPHADRWRLPLLSRAQVMTYASDIYERVQSYLLSNIDDPQRDYLTQYAIFHEDMHTEAFTYTRQTLTYTAPKFDSVNWTHFVSKENIRNSDVEIPGGSFMQGADKNSDFVFDNEKWAHAVRVKPFRISRTAVSNEEYQAFVDAEGYQQREYWCADGWSWRKQRQLSCPIYWRRGSDGWEQRCFDQWRPLHLQAAMVHVSWYEAQAYCRWAGRRLPTELEWEVAASAEPESDRGFSSTVKRIYPWGNELPTHQHANFDGITLGTIDVNALPLGDSAYGCRQMMGNVWEWTSSMFRPYLGFVSDMYQDYSQPLFNHTRVLKGGAWPTRSRMMRNTLRTFYGPDRNDVFAGFRTCAE